MKKVEQRRTNGDGLAAGDPAERRRIGATLRAFRIARGITPDELANAVGMSRPLLANVEAGRRNLNYKYLNKIAEVLCIPALAIMRPELARDYTPRAGNEVV